MITFSPTQILEAIPVDPLTGSIAVPIYQTSTFAQEAPGVNKGFDYSRTRNPTRSVLENLLATLEGGTIGLAFSSGLSAVDAVVKLLEQGDEIIAVDNIYGGTYRLFESIYSKFGIRVNYVDTTDPAEVEKAITERTELIWLESPTNPTLRVCDIRAISEIAHRYNVLVCVDNTFATPALQQPLGLGADIVLHSATKYLGGHSDVIAGALVTRDEALGKRLQFIQNATGLGLSPFDAWLVVRGIETLPVRMRRICRTAEKVARYLQEHPAVAEVHYPGLEQHPQHETAKRNATGFGGVVSFSLREDTIEAATNIVSATRVFTLAESLGGTKSLINHPAQMTHKSIPSDVRHRTGIRDSLIRLSIGLEDSEDLIADLDEVLTAFYVSDPKTKLESAS